MLFNERRFEIEQSRLQHLEDKAHIVAGKLEAILTRAGLHMSAQEIGAAKRIEQLEATIEKLVGTVHEVCETLGLPPNCGEDILGRPRLPQLDEEPCANIHFRGPTSQHENMAPGPSTPCGHKRKASIELTRT
jgi:hypothetical protein